MKASQKLQLVLCGEHSRHALLAQTVLCMDVHTFMNDKHHTFQQDNYSKQSQKGFLHLIIHRTKQANQCLQMGMHFWPSPPHRLFPEKSMNGIHRICFLRVIIPANTIRQ